MATTTNYGWTTPDDTALVKDGASAIRSLGTSVDTTTKNLNPSTTLGDIEYRSSTSNTNTRLGIGSSGQALTVVAGVPSWAASPTSVLTTTGDVLYASAANTLARLGIGSSGNVLTVSGGLPVWAAPTTSGQNFTLLNTGGTTLSGANTITISGISGIDQLLIVIQSGDSNSTSERFGVQVNGLTSGYVNTKAELGWESTYNAGNYSSSTATTSYIQMGKFSASTGSLVNAGLTIFGCSTSGLKPYIGFGGGRPDGNSGHTTEITSNVVNTTAITSVSAYVAGGTWSAGTLYVYGA
jgi:hypothetical protein